MQFINQIIEFIKASFRMPSAEMMALTELEQAKRELLSMQTAKDYSSRMVEYNQDRIRRLTAHIAKSTQAPTLGDVV
jgi:hypothetical protein